MADPITSAAAGAGIASSKLLNVAAGFLGALVALGTNDQRMPVRMLLALLLFAVLLSYFVPPMAVAAMREAKWAESLQSEGFIGCLLGLGCLYIHRAFRVIGRRFAKDPVAFIANSGKEPPP